MILLIIMEQEFRRFIMNTQKLTAILAAIVLLTAAGAKAEISNTRTASCLVKVTCDPAILPVTLETIEYLLHSSGVAGAAADELDLSAHERDACHEFFSIQPLSVTPTPPDVDARPKPAARPARPPRPARVPATTTTRPRPDDEPDLDDRPKPAASRRATGRSRGLTGPDQPADERALKEMRYMEETAKYKRKTSAEEEEKGKPRPRSRRTSRTSLFGRTVREPERQSEAAALPPVTEQTLLFQLEVGFPDEVKPAAEEFMKALIKNLRETLMAADDAYRTRVDQEFTHGRTYRDWAHDRLSEALGLTVDTEADRRTRDQLEAKVDLSGWRPEMAFSDAIEQLKNSVAPPLKLVVLWSDLAENAEIDQTTPINIDGLSEAPLSKALDLLLKSVASGRGVEFGYEIDGGVITIATAHSLPSAERRLSQIAQTDTPVEMLLERRNDLFTNKQRLEMDIARDEARRSAIEEQISRIDAVVTDKVKSDFVCLELQRMVDLHTKRLEEMNRDVDAVKLEGREFIVPAQHIDELTEKLARAKIELAKRHDELSDAVGGNRLRDLNVNLTDVVIDLAMSRAEFEVVSRQLAETEEQLKTASAFDPEISQIRLAQEELEMAERWVSELHIRFTSLREPSVTVLGGI
jgi:hypothetical protein